MKPKSKSSAALTVLLFAFLHGWAGNFVTPDTLILDGEIIYIDPKEELVNSDSLEDALKGDFYQEKSSGSFAFAVLISSDFQNTRWFSGGTDEFPLDVFLGRESSWYVRPGLDAEVILRNHRSLKLFTGVGIRSWSYTISQVEKADLTPASQRFKFENRDGELWQYSLIEVGPGFETDTSQVRVNSYRRTRTYLNIPFGVRFSPEKWSSRTDWRPYFDLAVTGRLPLGGSRTDTDEMQVVLVDELGSYREMDGLSYEKRPYRLVPFIQAGALWQPDEHWAMRAQVAIMPIVSTFSKSEHWRIQGHNVPFTIGVQWTP